jgi:hypothetical protein
MKLDALKKEVRALDTKMETTSSQVAEQLSIVPTLPTISQIVSEATRGRDTSKGQCKEEDTWSKATIEGHFEQQDTWMRPAVENDDTTVAPTISKLIREDTWTR